MAGEQRREQRIAELQTNWKLLGEKITRMQEAQILETRADEKLRLEKTLETLTAERDQIEEALSQMEKKSSPAPANAASSPARDHPADSTAQASNRSISIGGNASGNVITTGDHNTATLNYRHTELPPPPQSVDIKAELRALREQLAQLETPHRIKIDNALDEAEEELTNTPPDKDEIGKSLDRALDYAKKAEGFVTVGKKLLPPVRAIASWLGEQWFKLLNIL